MELLVGCECIPFHHLFWSYSPDGQLLFALICTIVLTQGDVPDMRFFIFLTSESVFLTLTCWKCNSGSIGTLPTMLSPNTGLNGRDCWFLTWLANLLVCMGRNRCSFLSMIMFLIVLVMNLPSAQHLCKE